MQVFPGHRTYLWYATFWTSFTASCSHQTKIYQAPAIRHFEVKDNKPPDSSAKENNWIQIPNLIKCDFKNSFEDTKYHLQILSVFEFSRIPNIPFLASIFLGNYIVTKVQQGRRRNCFSEILWDLCGIRCHYQIDFGLAAKLTLLYPQ